MVNLTSDLFEDYRDRRLKQVASRGTPGGRGQYKFADHKPKLRKDGKPRKNAGCAKAFPKGKKLIAPGTVKKELTLLTLVIDEYRKKLGLPDNPVSKENVKRPAVNDARDVRLSLEEMKRLLDECHRSNNRWLGPIVEFAVEVGPPSGQSAATGVAGC
jgi:integrase